MNHTTNYNLNQWAASDRVQRTDFNADNAKIDAALAAHARTLAEHSAAIPKLAVGSYTGDGAATRFISLGFTPKAVLVFNDEGYSYKVATNYSAACGGLAVTDHPAGYSAEAAAVQIVSGGFQVSYLTTKGLSHSNQGGENYNYLALG